MAFIPSANAKALSSQIAVQPNTILEIEGIPIIFGTQEISKLWKFDDDQLFDTPGLRFDTPFPDPNARDYISLDKTSKQITQQVLPDRSGTSSTLKMNIEIVDYNGEVTELFKSGNHVGDLIGQRAVVYQGFKEGSHPEDSIPMLNGYIDSITPTGGAYILSISHSENKKRQELFDIYTAQLTAGIDNTTTTIPVDSTTELKASIDSMTTYIQIEDEIMQVVSIDSDIQLTVIRSSLQTLAVSHDTESDIASVYGLTGNAIELALKLYLSGGDEFYQTLTPTSFVDVNGDQIPNSIFFSDVDLNEDVNVTEGDTIVISGATNPENDGTFIADDIINVSNGSYIVSNGAGFVSELELTANVSFKSQFNVLSEGCGLTPFDVDIQGHLDTLDLNFSSLPTYQFYLKEEINAKDFIDTELYFPSACYSINRNAAIGVKYTTPPLALTDLVTFNSENITDINKVKIERSTHKFMYNTIVYKYESSPKTDKFLAGQIILDADARTQTDKIKHSLKIESAGLRRNADTNSLITRQSNRFLQRYRLGASVYKNIEILLKDAWTLDIGDVILFGGEDVLIPSLADGTTYTPKKYLEIVNRKANLVDSKISFDCLETGFDIGARYAVISPASNLTTNSTTTKLELTLSFFTGRVDTEREKWQSFVGERIRVRNDDYSYDEITTITGLAPENDEVLNVEALTLAPPAGCFIEIPAYDENSASVDENYKARYTYNSYQGEITSITDESNFEVLDATRYIIGGSIIVHTDDYTRDSVETFEIGNIVGNIITLTEPLPFLPVIGDKIESMTFKDNGFAYRYI